MRILVFCAAVLFTSCLFINKTTPTTIQPKEQNSQTTEQFVNYKVQPTKEIKFNYAVSRNIAVKEVIATWETIFNDAKVSKKDKRRKNKNEE